MPGTPKNVEEYIDQFPPEIQKRLNELRNFIRAEVPEAEERISYKIPAYFLIHQPTNSPRLPLLRPGTSNQNP